MSSKHHHEAILAQFFAHPTPTNIHWRDVVRMFEALGAEVDETKHGHLKVKLNGQERSFQIPHHHSLENKDEVVAIRHFLTAAGLAPAKS